MVELGVAVSGVLSGRMFITGLHRARVFVAAGCGPQRSAHHTSAQRLVTGLHRLGPLLLLGVALRGLHTTLQLRDSLPAFIGWGLCCCWVWPSEVCTPHSPTHSLVRPLTRSLTHPTTHSLTHSLVGYVECCLFPCVVISYQSHDMATTHKNTPSLAVTWPFWVT